MNSFWAAMPFVLLLLTMAVMPLIAHRWWERNYPYVTALLSLPVIFGYLVVAREPQHIGHLLREYFSFIALIGSLYVIAGGVLIRIVGPPRPIFNTLILATGAVLSNIVGTTGASMLLIRSFLNINRRRYKPYLAAFFIFIVANIGGALTPIGDPPLFLGYVNGIPFFWVIGRLWYIWIPTLAILLSIFYWFDNRNCEGGTCSWRPLRIQVAGYRSLVLLGIVLVAVFAQTPVRELIMIGAASASLLFTRKVIHRRNLFSLRPIVEVAVLFAGVFVTMAPVLGLLEVNAQRLGCNSAGAFFWMTGGLSGFLDNAPTYRVFLELARTLGGGDITTLLAVRPELVKAVSLGAVFFGALTYIGNGPNLMVRSIAAHRHLPVPHFFEYMVRFSLPILLPVFVFVWLLLIIT